jgi:outer membrane protein TolC
MRISAFIILILMFQINETKTQNLKIFNLQEAISAAMKNNSDLQISRMEKLKADARINEVYAENLIPTITLNSRYTRNFKKQVFEMFGQKIEISTDNNIIHSFDISEPIPVLGTPVFSAVRIAEYYSRLQNESIRQTETNIKADVTKAFLNVLLLKEIIEVNKTSLSNAEENLRVVEARYKAGVNTEFDYLRAKVNTENIKPQLKQAENNLEIARKFLKNTIGIKTAENIDAVGSLSYDSTEILGNSDDLIRKISEQNVSIRQLKIGKLINEELHDIDGSGFLPKLYVFGQYSLNAQENDEKSFFKYRYYNSLAAGIGLTWNLNLLRHKYKEQQSEIEMKKSEEQIIKVKELLKTQSENVLLKIEDAKNRIIAQRQNIILSEKGVELANISFKSGVINQIDVLDAELTLSRVKLGYIQAIYDYLIAKTELEQLLEK